MGILKTFDYSLNSGVCVKVQRIVINDIPQIDYTAVGCDPGTKHLGLAVLPQKNVDDRAVLYEITLQRLDSAVDRICEAQKVLENVLYPDRLLFDSAIHAIIEGASFNDPYRQAELAEQRASIALYLIKILGMKVDILPPMTIRKLAFGSAKVKYTDKFPELPKNAAAAWMCALAAIKRKEQLEKD